MTKKAYFYIDDTIWVLRDLSRTRPASLFDVPLLQMLKAAHDKYGLRVQLNLFYRTDSFYGNDDFCLADVTDAYKPEWESAADWLRLAFHAKEEFPDYPHVNARYEDTYAVFKAIEKEVFRFAGEKTFTYATCPHWLPVSLEGVRALYDCGVRLMDATYGEAAAYDGNPDSLPYGHAMRLLHNRQPETRIFSRDWADEAIRRSVCAYNHLTPAQNADTFFNTGFVQDSVTGMKFKTFCSGPCLNLVPFDALETAFSAVTDKEYLGVADHEQYFYEDYLAWQPDYAQKINRMCEILLKNGYSFIFAEELL